MQPIRVSSQPMQDMTRQNRCVELQLWEPLEFVERVQKFPELMEQGMGQHKDRVRPL